MTAPITQTEDPAYTERLRSLSGVWWKTLLNVQAPYRRNVLRFCTGRTLDVGCGVGRFLRVLPAGSIGVDHNPSSVQACRDQGMVAYTIDDFMRRTDNGLFDCFLIAHVFEHMTFDQGKDLLASYRPFLAPGGRVMVICPQERGYTTDASHVEFMEYEKLSAICQANGLVVERCYSFPFPRFVGRFFTHNESVVIARG